MLKVIRPASIKARRHPTFLLICTSFLAVLLFVKVSTILTAGVAIYNDSAKASAVSVQKSLAWWVPLGPRGGHVDAVLPQSGHIVMRRDGQLWISDPAGIVFTRSDLPFTAKVMNNLSVSPATLSGFAFVVDRNGNIQRRDAKGRWQQSFVFLPETLFKSAPRVTAIAAFDKPISNAIYIASDGYSILESINGGEDWLRAGPGLPDHVFTLYADSTRRALYAGTDDGLWVHALQALPEPVAYSASDLIAKRLFIGIITLVTAIGAFGGLRYWVHT